MKKVILIITALVMVASGVAAVSAYEAHVINVKAKVENALFVANDELDFGTVFPQEWLNVHTTVEFSTSWGEQERVNTVDFEVWAEDKFLDAGPDNVAGTADDNYYPWLGEALFIEMNGVRGYIGAATASPLHAQPALDGSGAAIIGTLDPGNTSQTVTMYLDVPVFDEFYNPETDVANKKRPDWADTLAGVDAGDPCQILPLTTPQGYEMGVDIKIQVVDIEFVAQ